MSGRAEAVPQATREDTRARADIVEGVAGVAGGGDGGGAEEYVSAAKRDAMRKREWERRNLRGGQAGLDEEMARLTGEEVKRPAVSGGGAAVKGGARGMGEYSDKREVDKTRMEGHVTREGIRNT
jgi:hypothetical protein